MQRTVIFRTKATPNKYPRVGHASQSDRDEDVNKYLEKMHEDYKVIEVRFAPTQVVIVYDDK